jgi:acetoin utilization protein AcuB
MDTPSTIVGAWMHTQLHVAHPHDSIEAARALCERHRINQLPVIADGKLVGIVTDRDLRDAFPSIVEEAARPDDARREISSIHVEDVMTANVLTVAAGDPIERAAMIMRRERVGALPVVRNDRVIGILTRTDLLQALVAVTTVLHAGH